jgi:hypothetical protein
MVDTLANFGEAIQPGKGRIYVLFSASPWILVAHTVR